MFNFLLNLFKRKPQQPSTPVAPIPSEPQHTPATVLKPLPKDELLLMDDQDLLADEQADFNHDPLTAEEPQVIMDTTENK